MPTCLYCRAATTGAEGEAHILPEAVVANRLVLPKGAVCDGCNNYLSHLDSALAGHSLVAFGIQAFGLPGKRGKPRAQLGWFERVNSESSCALKVPARGIKVLEDRDGRPFVGLQPPVGNDRAQFHRALYYVAFNLLAHCHGVDSLLDVRYDDVRRYIRCPKPNEVWPYCHALLTAKPIDFVHLSVLKSASSQVALFLFNHGFAVDILRTESLLQGLASWAPEGVSWSEVS